MADSTTLGIPTLLPRRTTSDDIADALRDAIAKGQFGDGEELNQVALARHFGVSRVPVREALRQLQAEGLVSARAHMRTVVTGLTLERILEVLDLRALVEVYLLERAAERVTPADIAQLRALCDRMDGVKDHEEWLRRNKEFHRRLYAHSGAETAQELAAQLTARVERYLHIRHDRGVRRVEEANAEHRRIVDALARADLGSARTELQTHIGHTRERIVTLFRGGGDPSVALEDQVEGSGPSTAGDVGAAHADEPQAGNGGRATTAKSGR